MWNLDIVEQKETVIHGAVTSQYDTRGDRVILTCSQIWAQYRQHGHSPVVHGSSDLGSVQQRDVVRNFCH